MSTTGTEEVDLTDWIGRTTSAHDVVAPTPVAALSATLDYPVDEVAAGRLLPPLWHWLYFLPLHRQSELGPDGHPERGGFLPPVSLPRRMWAGGRFEFHAPLRVGDNVVRTSTIEDVVSKQGRSGPLVFVTVRHEVHRGDGQELAMVEHHDIVYRAERMPDEVDPPPTVAPTGAAWQRRIVPDPVLLFRYSALTFNGHRIHYDRDYVTKVEGYPGLVVHGPLTATLLIDLLRRSAPELKVKTFEFRALRPLYDTANFFTCGVPDPANRGARLWTRDAEGAVTMQATATW